MGPGPYTPGTMLYSDMRNPSTPDGKRTTEMLTRLPIHTGSTYRGLSLSDEDLTKLIVSPNFVLTLHSSSSTDKRVAIQFADSTSDNGRQDNAILMEFRGRGRNINPFLPEELQNTEEVVLLAGTKYKITSISDELDTTYGLKYKRIVLQEQ